MIKFIDLFRGIGGFHLGLQRAGGYQCVWSNDINKYASQIYKSHWSEEAEYTGDIRGVNEWDIPDHDLLCAGFPCQSFSTAGKRKGFEDTHGTLFFEICRVIKAKKPKLLLLENVKGLLNHDGGRTFTVIIQALDELGYWIEWQVLNSKYFGVPQNRERVFIIGHLRGTSGREIFPITEDGGFAYEAEKEVNGQNSLSLTKGNASGQNARGTYVETPKIVGTLTDGGHSGGLHSDMTIVFDPYNKAERRDGLAGALKTNQGSPTSTGTAVAVLTPDREKKRQNGPRFKEDGSMFTLTSQDRHGVMVYNLQSSGRGEGKVERRIREGFGQVGTGQGGNTRQENTIVASERRIRRLTPIECERLQGFPDGWTDGISDTQRYKCLGNAVTVNVIEYLGKMIVEAEQSEG